MNRRYAPGVAKLEANEKTQYNLYWPHATEASLEGLTNPSKDLLIAGIDIGTKNFCMKIEKRTLEHEISLVSYHKWSLLDVDCIYTELYRRFASLKILLDLDVVIIERQLPQATRSIIRLMQHAISWFMLRLANRPNFALIFDVNPKLKAKILGFTKYKDHKACAVIAARHLAETNGEKDSLEILTRGLDKPKLTPSGRISKAAPKLDDLADCPDEIEALLKHLGCPLVSKWKPNKDTYLCTLT